MFNYKIVKKKGPHFYIFLKVEGACGKKILERKWKSENA